MQNDWDIRKEAKDMLLKSDTSLKDSKKKYLRKASI